MRIRMGAAALALLIVAGALSGCTREEDREYAPKQPNLQYNRHDQSMDPFSRTAPIFP